MPKINFNTKSQNKYVDTSQLPIEWESSQGSKITGVFLIIFSLFWGGAPTAILIGTIAKGKFEPEILFILFFTVIGIGIFIGGLALFFYKRSVVISKNKIKISIKSIRGYHDFNEQFSNYKGVKNYSEYHSGSKNSPSYTLYINELVHADNKRLNIKLDVQRNSESGMRALWENHCKNLGLQAISGNSGDEVVRKVEDLDKNVKTLIAEGKIEPKFDPRDHPPKDFKLSIEDGKLKIVMKDSPSIYVSMFFVLAVAGVFAYFMLFKDGFRPDLVFPLIIICIFIIVPLWVVIYHALTRDCVYLTSTQVVNCRIKFNGYISSKHSKQMNYADIETITIEKESSNNSGLGLMLKSDYKKLHIAKGQKREKLEWLKNCILSSIARG